MNQQTIKLIDKHLKKARKKHPRFTNQGIIEVPAIAAEELGEMIKEINQGFYEFNLEKIVQHHEQARKEALDLIAVLVRFIEGEV